MKRQVGSENVDEAERIQCVTATTHKHKTTPPKWLSRFADVIQPESRKNHFTRLNNYRTGTQIADLK